MQQNWHSLITSNLADCAFMQSGPDLPTGYVGLSIGPQDPRGPPANCGTHRVNWRYMISWINIRHQFMSYIQEI